MALHPVRPGPGQARPGETGPGQARPGQTGPGEPGPGEARPGQAVPLDTGPGQARPSQTGPGQPRPSQTGPGQALPVAALPEARRPGRRVERATTDVDLTLDDLAVDRHVHRATASSREPTPVDTAKVCFAPAGVGVSLALARSSRPLPCWAGVA